jgi:hypothetical protein
MYNKKTKAAATTKKTPSRKKPAAKQIKKPTSKRY